jgi:hypothetical protein
MQFSKVKRFGNKDMRELQYPNRMKVMISYETPVVLFDGHEYFTCQEKYSRTTSKQISFYFGQEVRGGGPYSALNVKRIPASELHGKIKALGLEMVNLSGDKIA